jgi:hypothetical protein
VYLLYQRKLITKEQYENMLGDLELLGKWIYKEYEREKH